MPLPPISGVELNECVWMKTTVLACFDEEDSQKKKFIDEMSKHLKFKLFIDLSYIYSFL